jgi:hypothetical protein
VDFGDSCVAPSILVDPSILPNNVRNGRAYFQQQLTTNITPICKISQLTKWQLTAEGSLSQKASRQTGKKNQNREFNFSIVKRKYKYVQLFISIYYKFKFLTLLKKF